MLADVLEIFDWFAYGFAGWRYLLSPSFRARTHKRWKTEPTAKAVIEVLFCALGMLLTLLLLALVVWCFVG